MKNLFKKISYLGVNKSETTTIEEDINIFVNQTIFWIAVLTFSYCFVYTFFELYALLFIALSYIVLWNLLFVLNIKKKFNLSKLLILIIGNGQIFTINYFAGWDSGLYNFLIPASIASYVFYSQEKNYLFISFSTLSSFLFLICFYFRLNNISYYKNSNQIFLNVLNIFSFISSIGLTGFFFSYLIKFNNKYASLQKEEVRKSTELLKALQENTFKTNSILETTIEGFWLIQDEIIREVNDSMLKILGKPRDKILSQSVNKFLDDTGREIFRHEYMQTLKGIKGNYELTLNRDDGTSIPCLIHSTPFIDTSGKITGFFAFVTDISEMKFFQKELVKAMKQADEATKAKSFFLANMSHEIRTPMNAIIGLSGLALKQKLDLKVKDYIEKVNTSGKSLLRILNDILDFSKIEAGKLDIEYINFDLNSVLDHCINITGEKIREKKLDFFVIQEPNIPKNLLGDPLRTSQILINLINNAIKFTENGSVSLKIDLLKKDLNKVLLQFTVQDTGIGLSKEQSAKLFKPFNQSDSSNSRKYGGTGLGLSISKNLVEMMNGKIWVESELDKGSMFKFTIELLESNESQSDIQIPIELELLNIVVISKSKSNQEIIARYLADSSFRLNFIDSTEDFFNNLDIVFDTKLVIIDDALELNSIHLILNKLNELNENIKSILLTNLINNNLDNNLLLFSDVIQKPFSKKILTESILNIFYGLRVEVEKYKKLENLNILLVEDNEINQQIATELLQSIKINVDLANNGKECINKLKENINKYNLILMDIQMPEMDGITATKHIKSIEEFKNIPIIALTAHAMQEEIENCKKIGMIDYIGKPIEPTILFDVILKYSQEVKNTTSNKGINSIESTNLSIKVPIITGLDTIGGLRRVAGNKEIYIKILKQFYNNYNNCIETIKECMLNNDYETVILTVHSLKGVAGNIGHKQIQTEASELEKAIHEKNEALISDKLNFLEFYLNEFILELSKQI
jgi:two-component system, sensor histidine kinase and response regulator